MWQAGINRCPACAVVRGKKNAAPVIEGVAGIIRSGKKIIVLCSETRHAATEGSVGSYPLGVQLGNWNNEDGEQQRNYLDCMFHSDSEKAIVINFSNYTTRDWCVLTDRS